MGTSSPETTGRERSSPGLSFADEEERIRAMADERDENKCAHEGCNCRVSGDEKYCSEYCRDAGDITEIGCGCEHAGCP
jgi:hypothetical protein